VPNSFWNYRKLSEIRLMVYFFVGWFVVIYDSHHRKKEAYAHQGCIYLIKSIKNTVKSILLLWNIFTLSFYLKPHLFFCMRVFKKYIFYNVIYSCDGKAEFYTSLLQSSFSHDPSEIILICWFSAQNFL